MLNVYFLVSEPPCGGKRMLQSDIDYIAESQKFKEYSAMCGREDMQPFFWLHRDGKHLATVAAESVNRDDGLKGIVLARTMMGVDMVWLLNDARFKWVNPDDVDNYKEGDLERLAGKDPTVSTGILLLGVDCNQDYRMIFNEYKQNGKSVEWGKTIEKECLGGFVLDSLKDIMKVDKLEFAQVAASVFPDMEPINLSQYQIDANVLSFMSQTGFKIIENNIS